MLDPTKQCSTFLILHIRNKTSNKVHAYSISDPSLYFKEVSQGISALDKRLHLSFSYAVGSIELIFCVLQWYDKKVTMPFYQSSIDTVQQLATPYSLSAPSQCICRNKKDYSVLILLV